MPLDDNSLFRSTGWTRPGGDHYFRRTVSRASDRGATLAIGNVRARRIALLVTTCRGCGEVKVSWNGRSVGRISLNDTRTRHRQLRGVETFDGTRRGRLEIEVVSEGRKVLIDGVGLSRL